MDLARPDVILPDPYGDATPDADTEESREPSQTVEVRVVPDLATAAAVNASINNSVNASISNSVNTVNLDEAELAAATSQQPKAPPGITRQQGAYRTAIPADSPFTDNRQFSWLAWQEAFRQDPDTAPAVNRKARMRRPGKPRQLRPQGPHEGPPGSPGATWQQGRLALEWQ